MAKLTGYNRVAVIEQGGRDYHFALYDDDIKVGDDVLIKKGTCYYAIENIEEIITPEEAAERFKKNITAEIICKVNLFAYENRVLKRKQAENLKKEMDKKIKEMQEVDKYQMYAERNPELAEMLNTYKNLVE